MAHHVIYVPGLADHRDNEVSLSEDSEGALADRPMAGSRATDTRWRHGRAS